MATLAGFEACPWPFDLESCGGWQPVNDKRKCCACKDYWKHKAQEGRPPTASHPRTPAAGRCSESNAVCSLGSRAMLVSGFQAALFQQTLGKSTTSLSETANRKRMTESFLRISPGLSSKVRMKKEGGGGMGIGRNMDDFILCCDPALCRMKQRKIPRLLPGVPAPLTSALRATSAFEAVDSLSVTRKAMASACNSLNK